MSRAPYSPLHQISRASPALPYITVQGVLYTSLLLTAEMGKGVGGRAEPFWGYTEKRRIWRRSFVILSAVDCWDKVGIETRGLPQLQERCKGRMKWPGGLNSAQGPCV